VSEDSFDPMVADALRIMGLLDDEIVTIKPEERDHIIKSTFTDDKGKERVEKVKFADELSQVEHKFKIWRDDKTVEGRVKRWEAASGLVRAFNYGQKWRYFETGEGFVIRLNEQENLVKKLTEDLATRTTERDAWKKRYEDCERLKFRTSGGTLTGDVEEPR
jgi:hypothetical protein